MTIFVGSEQPADEIAENDSIGQAVPPSLPTTDEISLRGNDVVSADSSPPAGHGPGPSPSFINRGDEERLLSDTQTLSSMFPSLAQCAK